MMERASSVYNNCHLVSVPEQHYYWYPPTNKWVWRIAPYHVLHYHRTKLSLSWSPDCPDGSHILSVLVTTIVRWARPSLCHSGSDSLCNSDHQFDMRCNQNHTINWISDASQKIHKYLLVEVLNCRRCPVQLIRSLVYFLLKLFRLPVCQCTRPA